MNGQRFTTFRLQTAQLAWVILAAGRLLLCDAQGPPHESKTLAGLPTTDKNAEADSALQLGIALTRRGLFTDAIPHFLKAKGRVSDDYALEFNLALCYVGTAQFQKALPVLTNLRESSHQGAGVENLLAQAYAGDDQVDQAFDALHKAEALAPNDEKLYLFVAEAFQNRQSYSVSLRVVELGLQHLPNSARLHYERGYLLSLLDDYDAAKKDYRRADQLAPHTEIGYLALAQENLYSGNLTETIRVSRAARAEGIQDYQLLAILGETLIRTGASPGQPEFKEALDALERSVAAKPNYASSQIALGHVYLLAQQLGPAIEHLEIGKQLSPRNPAVFSLLASAYRKRGQPEQARAMLAILAKLNEEQVQKIRAAPGDAKAIPGASRIDRGREKP